jgi:hypothetical protein
MGLIPSQECTSAILIRATYAQLEMGCAKKNKWTRLFSDVLPTFGVE